jgi:hypothetical protein
MKKPWSIATALRNPDRARNFLKVLKKLEGSEWNEENQEKYQILLIQDRVYGYGSIQFYNGLTDKQVSVLEDLDKEISFDEAKEIFDSKNYEAPAMRGRQSINPLKKLGFTIIENGKVLITELGNELLKEDFDYGEVFFRGFIKYQIPNPDNNDYSDDGTYNIKPFIGTLHLINEVNLLEKDRGNKAKGLSKEEFALFAPTMVSFEDIKKHAEKIIELRDRLKDKNKQEQKETLIKYKQDFASEFLETNKVNLIEKLLKNLKDYGDNAIRYFRLTRFLYIRGNGFYVDLEPRRSVEINNLLNHDSSEVIVFDSTEQYFEYLKDINKPELPWETKEEYKKIISQIEREIGSYEENLDISENILKNYQIMNETELKKYINELRSYRRRLQEKEIHDESQGVEKIKEYVEVLENIYEQDDRPIILEKYITLGLNALNDAIKIKPNYPVGDDNEPTFTAPANTPDIECYYENYNAICEVTMLNGRDQWYNEGQPVMRHLRDFEELDNSKESYCLFIAPKLHRDTVNTFWVSVKYEYEGKKQKIVPLDLKQFIEMLKILIKIKENDSMLSHKKLFVLYDKIIDRTKDVDSPTEWLNDVSSIMESWKQEVLS